jgi:hypothetical protein
MIGGFTGCGGDSTGPTTAPPYRRVQLNHHAITLATVAPYDTIRLTTTPVDVNGTPVTTALLTKPVYTTSDTSITIDSTGFVRVHRTGSDKLGIPVIATLQVGSGVSSVTLADTAFVNVVNFASAADVPQLHALHLEPFAGDSARRPVVDALNQPGLQSLDNALVTTATGAIIQKAVVRVVSSDSLIASVTTPLFSPEAPQVTTHAPGVVLLRAEATVFGTRLTDSLWYVVGYPLRLICAYGTGEYFLNADPTAGVSPVPATNVLSLGQLMVGQGGAVLWGNSIVGTSHDSLDIQFDRTTGVGGVPTPIEFQSIYGLQTIEIPAGHDGNIPAFPAAPQVDMFGFHTKLYDATTSKARVFTQAGTYQWHSTLQGIQGTVMVISNDSLLAHK